MYTSVWFQSPCSFQPSELLQKSKYRDFRGNFPPREQFYKIKSYSGGSLGLVHFPQFPSRLSLPGNCNLLSGRSPGTHRLQNTSPRVGVRKQSQKGNIKGKRCIWLFPSHNILKPWSSFFFSPQAILGSHFIMFNICSNKILKDKKTTSRLQLEIPFYPPHGKSESNWLPELLKWNASDIRASCVWISHDFRL